MGYGMTDSKDPRTGEVRIVLHISSPQSTWGQAEGSPCPGGSGGLLEGWGSGGLMVQQVQAPCDWMVCTASPINGKSHRVTELNTGVTVGMELEPVRSEPPLPSSLAPLWGAQVTHVSQLSPCYMLEAIAPPHRGCEISVTPFSTQGECRGLTPVGRGAGFPLSRLCNRVK